MTKRVSCWLACSGQGWPRLWVRAESQSEWYNYWSEPEEPDNTDFPWHGASAGAGASEQGRSQRFPSHYAVTQWARVKTTPCQWSPVGLAIRWTVSRVRHWGVVSGQHWGRWDISDPGAVTSAGSLQCPHHCSSWSLGLAPCRAHWPVIFRSRQRSTKQEKYSLRLSRHWCFAQWVKIQFWMFSPSILCRLCSLWKFVCMLFEYSYLKEKKIGNIVMEPFFIWHFVFILKWSRGQMSPGARSCNAASVRPGRRCITCNAVYHHAATGQYHDCLFSPCTQKYRLRIRVKLIFSISEEAGDLVTRDAASWPPPVPHVSQDGVLRVCQGNFTVGDRFAK